MVFAPQRTNPLNVSFVSVRARPLLKRRILKGKSCNTQSPVEIRASRNRGSSNRLRSSCRYTRKEEYCSKYTQGAERHSWTQPGELRLQCETFRLRCHHHSQHHVRLPCKYRTLLFFSPFDELLHGHFLRRRCIHIDSAE